MQRFARFYTVVLDDPALQQRLRTIDDWDSFTAKALGAAGERGLTADDIDHERRQAL